MDNAVIDNNLAEAIVLELLYETNLYKEMYKIYKGIKGLIKIGLESYARSYANLTIHLFLAES